jgi:formamidopyrimidine-DNA glycosylase
MPEMPEVETIRRSLVEKVRGRRITNVIVQLPRLIKWPAAMEFQAVLTGKRINALSRKGKYLLFGIEDKLVLVVHLRMTGRLQYKTPEVAQDQYTRIIFDLDNGDSLLYADTRTLGTLYLVPEAELSRISGLAGMGPEPLTEEFSLDYFKNMLKKRQGKIKAVLLNQHCVGGLGNIYVDESLNRAGIHPERAACSLEECEFVELYHAINNIISDSLEHGGTTFRDYRDGLGNRGGHQNHLKIYGRKGAPCTRCGGTILWKEVCGRGTHYCPVCQK